MLSEKNFVAQQFYLSPQGIHYYGTICPGDTLEEVEVCIKKRSDSSVHPWIIFQKSKESSEFFPIRYINTKKNFDVIELNNAILNFL